MSKYLTHAALLDQWGYTTLSAHERTEGMEEVQHASAIARRIAELGHTPAIGPLPHIPIGSDIKTVLESDLQVEYDAMAVLEDARDRAHQIGDQPTAQLLEAIIRVEIGHRDFFLQQLSAYRAGQVTDYLRAEA